MLFTYVNYDLPSGRSVFKSAVDICYFNLCDFKNLCHYYCPAAWYEYTIIIARTCHCCTIKLSIQDILTFRRQKNKNNIIFIRIVSCVLYRIISYHILSLYVYTSSQMLKPFNWFQSSLIFVIPFISILSILWFYRFSFNFICLKCLKLKHYILQFLFLGVAKTIKRQRLKVVIHCRRHVSCTWCWYSVSVICLHVFSTAF